MGIKIAFTGWAGSGKSDAAKYIKNEYGADVISFADGIKYIDKYLFGNGKKDRNRLQKIGEFFRSIDPDIWVKRTVETVEFESDIVVDDLRRENEYEALKKAGFKFVRIVAGEDIRVERILERDGYCDSSLFYNESENGVAGFKMHEIVNDGSLEELHSKIDKLMESWGYEKF
jgi:dephospho-CoA kinase